MLVEAIWPLIFFGSQQQAAQDRTSRVEEPSEVWGALRGGPSFTKSSLSSNLSERSLGVGLRLPPTPLAGLLQLPTAPQAPLVPGQCLPSLPSLPEISFLPGKNLYLPKSLVLKVTRICVEDLPLAPEEGGRLAGGSRDPWSRGLQGSPPSHHSSSSAVLLGPRRAPHTPDQGERPAATPGSLHFASALLPGRRSASTRGGGRGGRIPPRAWAGGRGPGTGAELAGP